MKSDQPRGSLSAIASALGLASLVFIAAGGAGPDSATAGQSLLAPCPGKPNCVCSDDPDQGHRVPPYRLAAPPEDAWRSLGKVIAEFPRTEVVSVTETDLHAQVKSRLFGFVDDVVFQLRPTQNVIAVRSASRTGYSDLGVNRRRIEEIRQKLKELKVVE